MKYAYVTNELCDRRDARLPSARVGVQRISQHPEFQPWELGKKETLRLVTAGRNAWERATAAKVARVRRWA